MDLAQVVEMINSLGVNAKDAFIVYVVAKFGLSFIISVCLLGILAFALHRGSVLLQYGTAASRFYGDMYVLTNPDEYSHITPRFSGFITSGEASKMSNIIRTWKEKANG